MIKPHYDTNNLSVYQIQTVSIACDDSVNKKYHEYLDDHVVFFVVFFKKHLDSCLYLNMKANQLGA